MKCVALVLALTLAIACQAAPPTQTPSPPASSSPSGTPSSAPSATPSTAPAGVLVFSLEWKDALSTPENAGSADLFRIATDGTDLTQLTDRRAYSRYEVGNWFPDGSRFVATLEDENHNPILEVDPANRDTISVDTGAINAVEPEVSPDGSHILFRGGTKQDPQSAIYVMNADGSELTQLTHPPRGGYEGDVGPDYSPTGSQIVFVRDGAIEVMNTDGSDIHELLPATTKAWRPRWSPDGRQIVFGIEIDSSATENVWLMNADGSDAKPLVKCSCFANSPSWSPDGQFIVFSFRTITGVHSLELMRPDGLARTTIWTADALDFPFDAEWRPVTAD